MPDPAVTLTLPNHSVVLAFFFQGREGNNLYLYLLFFGGAPVTGQRSHSTHVSFGGVSEFPGDAVDAWRG